MTQPRHLFPSFGYCIPWVTVCILAVTTRISALEKEQNNKNPVLSESLGGPTGQLSSHIQTRNISGYYKGNWEVAGIDPRLRQSFFHIRRNGAILMEIRAGDSQSDTAHQLCGDVVLKKGEHITDDDLRFSLEALYFPEMKRLTGVLKPHKALYIPVTKDEIDRNTPSYRAALRREARKWVQETQSFGIGLPAERKFLPKHRCVFDIDVRIYLRNDTDIQFETPSDSSPLPLPDIVLNGTITSPNCGVNLRVVAPAYEMELYYTKAVHYTLVVATLSFVQILLLIKQIEGTSTPATSMRVSMFCISQQTVMDAYLCLLHLTVGIVMEPLFNAFALVSFFEFVLFAIFEMRYMLLIWRAQRGQTTELWDTRRELSVLYARFYGVLLLGIIAGFRLQQYMRQLVFLFYSFWIPQIVHCIRSDLRQPLKPFFIIGMSTTRLILPLYFYGCPGNVLGMQVHSALCLGLVSYVGLQAALLMVQYYYGPHCFLPKMFLPHKHDYFRSLDQNEIEEVLKRSSDREAAEAGNTECVICMNPVEVARPMARMVTPCNHFFHPQCLQRWMDVKMECPTCRQMLPPL